jgi:TonB family protein
VTKKQKRHIIATIGTLLFMLLVLLLLWYMRLEAVAPEQEEGVEIAFAEMEEEPLPPASGEAAYAEEPTDAAPAAPAQPAEAVATHPTPASPPEHIMSEEETLALARAKKEKEEREAAERARKQKEAEAIAKANAMGNLFGKTNGTNTSGDGTAQGSGSKGNPVGHGSSGGNSWSLAGRGIKGTLPQPSNDFQQEGRVLVEIRVNAAGNVISAVVKGGNISDKATQQLALEAARKAKFTEGDHDQIGTITYNFKFN